MAKLILLNKPFDVLSQFTDSDGRRTLADFVTQKGVYPAGRLDRDSEGLILLTDSGALQHKIAHPKKKMAKTYWVQVEGNISDQALQLLQNGVKLKDGMTKPAEVEVIDQPNVWQRDPPVRFRKTVPDSWLQLTIKEGKNRQVRRMTAAVGFPTLRLIRVKIGPWSLDALLPGQSSELDVKVSASEKSASRRKTHTSHHGKHTARSYRQKNTRR